MKESYYIGDIEAEAAPQFRDEDVPLKDDVNLLGGILGDLLETLESKTLFAHVELARQAARERRAGDREAQAKLTRVLSGLSPEEGVGVTRAFSAYFGLVNMAERVHRIRRRRDYQREGATQPDSFVAVLGALHDAGVEVQELSELLERLQFTPVFTAHPTESVRRTLLTKEQRIAHALLARLEPDQLTGAEHEALVAVVREELSIAWQTDEHFDAPTVRDEVEHVLFFLTQVVYAVLPEVYDTLQHAVDEVYGAEAGITVPRRMVRFASWVGGDMDGNPNVDAGTIRDTLARQRELIIELYRGELDELFEHLSQSRSCIDAGPAVDEAIARYQALLPAAWSGVPERYLDMPYRVLAALMRARLDATLDDAPGAYSDPCELGADLRVMLDAMAGHGDTGAPRVRRLALRVGTFGFHLATLDVRQDSAVHREAVAEALAIPDFPERSAPERLELLREALADMPAGGGAKPEGALERCLSTMRAIGEARSRYGADAVGPYIVSMTEGPDDALAVLLIARLAGLVLDDGAVPLDVAPLFETVNDLERAAATLDTLLAEPLYREHVRQRGDSQVIMIGYSDSNKESGIAASRWALHAAQIALVESTRAAPGGPVEPTLFHGRGGTISRGGGKPRAGILGEPPGVLGGQLRVTEQGEIIAQKYGLEDIALRTIEMTTGALLERTALQRVGSAEQATWHDAARTVAERSRAAYRALVYENPDFIDYFRAATPIDVIERMRIGSRPPARRSTVGVENLRAIPWVFAWTQSRHNLPGWYGVGTGLETLLDTMALDDARALAKTWRFFGNLLDDAEMVIAKTDMTIAAHYADLAGDAGARIYPVLLEEFERTRRHVCAILEIDDVLDDDPVLQRNIGLRNPYIDPMSLVQVDFLRRWRQSDRSDDALAQVLMTTVRGIARGMQNTG